jgi:hypothetical protein
MVIQIVLAEGHGITFHDIGKQFTTLGQTLVLAAVEGPGLNGITFTTQWSGVNVTVGTPARQVS